MSDNDIKGKRIAILGAGVSGLSLARLAARHGAGVFLSDASTISDSAKSSLAELGVSFEENGHTSRVTEADEVLVGSGFPPSAPVLQTVKQAGVKITGELDFVFRVLRSRRAQMPKIVGITGSNGKTTTTSLIGHILKQLGHDVSVVGNIGSPIADAADSSSSYIVCELSSFQLHWADDIQLDCAIVTNLAPDHIDWHGSYEAYAGAKAKIMRFVGQDGIKIGQRRDAEMLGQSSMSNYYALSWDKCGAQNSILLDADRSCAYLNGERLFDFSECRLIGLHNMENAAMALVAVKSLGIKDGSLTDTLGSFVPPPHRCALVCEIDGVKYVDDSKGTNIAATITALTSISGKKSLILGGKGKGENYADLVPTLMNHAKWVTLIGEETEKIALALDRGGYVNFSRAGCMEVAVKIAASHAEEGDVVLLSPACTSWDMYKNYKERGEHFTAIVKKMEERSAG